MNILGIQSGHNSSVALYKNNKLVYYNQEERLSKIEQENVTFKSQLEEIGKQPVSKGIKQPERNETVALTKQGRILQTIRKNRY